ncbi:WYL domain-containing protein [Myroides sp. NP-2]|uniref:WYL domain-containing protein n=1 Tax=Myroides sp. NP-2 TaxID=2759945 RepID=UPI0015FA7E2E|nr:WYL domain-containing protein [Myroides sp. NP-2]
MKSLPFQASQKIVNEIEATFTVELFMHPTNDFVMEIMRHGSICEVLEPQSLRENVREQVNEMYEKYKG